MQKSILGEPAGNDPLRKATIAELGITGHRTLVGYQERPAALLSAMKGR